jgi:hypothetical protein
MADMPMPKILCSKASVKSNCAHCTPGPNFRSRPILQVSAIAGEESGYGFDVMIG